MTTATNKDSGRTIRCAVFRDIAQTEKIVDQLRAAGFTGQQISVLCSDEGKEKHFRGYQHEHEAVDDEHTLESAAVGGLTGAAVGGLIAAGMTTIAGLAIFSAGAGLLVGGAVAGTFIGAMQSRGEEGALADFYDQSLTQGDLLVAVEDDDPGYDERLKLAEDIFRRGGASPVPLAADL
jgi:hypothetical protein